MGLKEISLKCFKCKDAKCIQNCPIHNNIPLILKLYSEERYKEAYDVLFTNNPLFFICGKLCPHEKQCAKECAYQKVTHNRIEIELIEQDLFNRFGFDFAFPSVTKGKIIVIGAGPAGLAASIILRKAGFEIVLCEAENKIGGVLSSQIPEFRFDDNIFKVLENKLSEYITIRLNTKLGSNLSFADLQQYDYQIIATGCMDPIRLSTDKNVLNGYEILRKIKKKENTLTYNKIGVLGCGNAAIDVARSLKRYGNDVSIIYRRNLENAPATKHEINQALQEGVLFKELLSLEKFDNNIATLRVMKLLPKEDGKRQMFEKTEILIQEEYDYLVEAYGSNPNFAILNNQNWFSFINDNNWLKTPSIGNLYFVGDFYNHATSIVNAINHAKIMCEKIISNDLVIKRIKDDLTGKSVVFGGSFNPPTIAHVEIYNYLLKNITDNVTVLPNGDFYPAKKLLSFEERSVLIKACMPNVKIDDYEKNNHFKGTVKFLEERSHPFFVIGSDSLIDLTGWIDPVNLIKNNRFIVFKRDSDDPVNIIESDELLSKYKDHFYVIDVYISNVSSSMYRTTLNEKMLEKNVLSIIQENKYYQ